MTSWRRQKGRQQYEDVLVKSFSPPPKPTTSLSVSLYVFLSGPCEIVLVLVLDQLALSATLRAHLARTRTPKLTIISSVWENNRVFRTKRSNCFYCTPGISTHRGMNTREIRAQIAHYFRNERHTRTVAMSFSCMHVVFYY